MAFQALNTAIIMELPDVVNQILDFISSLDLLGHDKTKLRGRTMDFTKGTSIYMGSMLGAYDLLNGEYKGLVKDVSNPIHPPYLANGSNLDFENRHAPQAVGNNGRSF
jgi:mannosyl-oligosaccharide alpha-1,2-mannosidase